MISNLVAKTNPRRVHVVQDRCRLMGHADLIGPMKNGFIKLIEIIEGGGNNYLLCDGPSWRSQHVPSRFRGPCSKVLLLTSRLLVKESIVLKQLVRFLIEK